MSLLVAALDNTEAFDVRLTTTNVTAVYANDTTFLTKLASLALCNRDAGAVTVTVEVYRDDVAASFRLYSEHSIAAKTTLTVADWTTQFGVNDELRVTASVANMIDVTGLVLTAYGR